ncbi:MAG: phosphatase PAP2 family protein [Acidimicrobiales bacterium]|nr:phosphatase PAP2 family protein [Acidimicrobiales bacterium]
MQRSPSEPSRSHAISAEAPTQTGLLAGLIKGIVAVTAGAILFGWLTLTGPGESINRDTFEPVVDALNAVPGLVSFSEVATDAGKLRFDQFLLLALAFAAGFKLEKPGLTWSVICVAAALGLRYFQSLVTNIVGSTDPGDFAESADLVIGTAGPYFSGGVFRVVVIVGLALSMLGLPRRKVFWIAAIGGVIEGITRMALGRHWLFDTIAAVPIGLGVLWCLVQARRILLFDLTQRVQ